MAPARQLAVVLSGDEDDPLAGLLPAGLLPFEGGSAFRIRPLLDAHQHHEVAVAQVADEEDLVALEAGIGPPQLARAPRGRRPHPPLLAGAARRDMQVARALEGVRRQVLHQGAMLSARVGALVDRGLARDAA